MNKTLIIVGSNSQNSINRMLGEYVATRVAGSETDIIDMLGFDIPVFSPARASGGIPQVIVDLVEQMKDYDSYIIISPEHNGSLPAAFKNVIDWMSVYHKAFLNERPVVIMSATPGPHGGMTMLSHLQRIIPRFQGVLVGIFSFGEFHQKFDIEERIITSETKVNELEEVLSHLSFKAKTVAA